MKELDVVKLVNDFMGINAGTEGVIVCEYDGKAFEVDFSDKEGDTIDVINNPCNTFIFGKRISRLT